MNNETQIQTKTIAGIGEQKLKMLIKESIKESIRAEILKLKAALLPYVSDKEQRDIEKQYGKPSCEVGRSYNVAI